MKILNISCPYCSNNETLEWDGLFKPVYIRCGYCERLYIAEPVTGGVECLKPEEADCCSDPDCRELEMGAGPED